MPFLPTYLCAATKHPVRPHLWHSTLIFLAKLGVYYFRSVHPQVFQTAPSSRTCSLVSLASAVLLYPFSVRYFGALHKTLGGAPVPWSRCSSSVPGSSVLRKKPSSLLRCSASLVVLIRQVFDLLCLPSIPYLSLYSLNFHFLALSG
jgi:hypothetical protein